jgi:hypothetical protein
MAFESSVLAWIRIRGWIRIRIESIRIHNPVLFITFYFCSYRLIFFD